MYREISLVLAVNGSLTKQKTEILAVEISLNV
jgi:hypothetical protein